MTDASQTRSTPRTRAFVLCLAMAAVATMAPVSVRLSDAGLHLDTSAAFAKSGKGKDGDGREDDDRDDDRDDRDDDDRDDDRDDNRDDDRDDRDSDKDDDRRGPGAGRATPDVIRLEVTGTGINVIYRDGSREVLSNGRYRREDASGRVLDSRAATGADLVRLRALAGNRAVPQTATGAPDPASKGHPEKIRLRGNDVIVEYSNGWTEAVERGRYRLTDRYGQVAVDRAATREDRARLRALAGR